MCLLIFLFGFSSEVNGVSSAGEALFFGGLFFGLGRKMMLLDTASSKTVKEQNLLCFTKEGDNTNPANLKIQVNLRKGPPKTVRKHAELPVDAQFPYLGTKTPTIIGKSLLLENSNNAETDVGTTTRNNVHALNDIFLVKTWVHI